MMADSSLDDYIQKKGIGLRMKSQKINLDRGFKRQNVLAVASEHAFQAKRSFDAREKLKTFQGSVGDARMKLTPKMPSDRINVTLPQRDARAKLSAKQNNLPTFEFDKCDNPSNFQLASIKKTLVKGVEPQTSNMGWSLVKTVTNDMPRASPMADFTPLQAISKTVLNTPARKVAQINSGSVKGVEKAQNEDKEPPSQTFVSPIQSYRVVISNLGPNVTYDDVEELFSSCGPLRKIKMSKPGSAEIFYVNVESAYEAVEEYHNRELDDRPMSVAVSLLQDAAKVNETKPLRSKKQLLALRQSLDVDHHVLSHALFRASADQASNAVDFTVHL